MSKKKKYPKRWRKQWFEIELYEPIGWLKRKRFYLMATTHETAKRKFKARWPSANILMIGNF